MKASLIAALLLLGTASVQGQSRKVVLDDDLEIGMDGDENILSNEALKKASLNSKTPKVVVADIVKTERFGLEYKFEGAASLWSPRGRIIVGKDGSGKIVNVEVENEFNAGDNFKETLNNQCSQDNLYQLRVKGQEDLLTSIPSCHLYKNGLNETLVFHTDSSGKSLSIFSYEIQDVNFLASIEKNPRKRRILTTKHFDAFTTKASVQ